MISARSRKPEMPSLSTLGGVLYLATPAAFKRPMTVTLIRRLILLIALQHDYA